jgi:hypothetical protein
MIHVVGSGWYGCHIIDKLIHDKFEYTCWEQNAEIFHESSSNNQNRLHLGFHYPRNAETRRQSKDGFSKFLNHYPKLSRKLDKNMYFVAKDSIVDFETYKAIYLHEGYLFEEVIVPDNIHHVEGGICTEERLILHETSKVFWKSKSFNVVLGEKVSLIDGKLLSLSGKRICSSEDIILDCTYGNLINRDDVFIEYFLSFIVHIDDLDYSALTFMDGPFFSIFPYENAEDEKLYTLTHVKYCVLKSKIVDSQIVKEIFSHVIADCSHFLPFHFANIELVDFFISKKTKPVSNSDSRAVEISVDRNVISVFSGKIDAIFHAEELVQEKLGSLLKL